MRSAASARLRAADDHCAALVRHYENFTVASRLAPSRLRRDVVRVYAFCRTTDDIGDETGEPGVALTRLATWRTEFEAMFAGTPARHPVLVALRPTVQRHRLSQQPFFDLIAANMQDQTTSSYADWPALLGYCTLSAAPVGRIVLQLFGVDDLRARALSDDVCIGLQLANFAQDVSVDAAKGRTYLLQSDLARGGTIGAVQAMCARARDLLQSGRALERMVHGRLRLQLALYRLGGEAILDAIAAAGYATAETRPTVSRAARARILLRAFAGPGKGSRVLPPQGTLPRSLPEASDG